ncbi:MAG: Do family serine endopeptidase [Spirochaetaceae bacterium]|nr:Do family serine endopeptidase [Spirochaetaceae bacterium]MCF7951491.1 Do family serine endopeptidase [Spirochaetaceae bacterium]
MNTKKLFYSKRFFLFNLVLVGVIAGFVLSFAAFSNIGSASVGEAAHAQGTRENGGENTEQASQPAPQAAGKASVPESFNGVAKKALPSVVELRVVDIVEQQVPQQLGWPWNFMTPEGQQGESQSNEDQQREFKRRGLGSGVIVEKRGNNYYILTNNHVVGKADEIKTVLTSGEEYSATIVGKDPRKDLALVKVSTGDSLPVAKLGNSDNLKIGDWVLAVGSPFGFVSSVTAGIVSAKGRSGPANNISEFIQTDAAINRGNSGGALVNMQGEVIGINTWIAAPSGGSVGLGFAVPINNAKQAIEQLISTGKVEYGWLGVSIAGMTESLAEKMNLPTQKGAFIHNVYLDSPAAKGGLMPGDFVTEVDGQKIANREELVRAVGQLEAGKQVEFTLFRYGEERTVTVEIGKRADAETIQKQQNRLWPGMIVVPLEKQARQQLNLDSSTEGVLVANVEKQSKAFIGGLRPYDVITEINGNKIASILDFYKVVNESSTKEFKVGFIREGNKYFVGLTK